MDENKINERLRFNNPWWVTGKVPESLIPKFHRNVFKKLLSYFSLNRIILLKGPRRTGKSTLLYQIIDNLLKGGVRAQDILYLSFDDPTLRIDLFEILKVYERINGNFAGGLPKKYVFLDEVHFLSDWAAMLKNFYDKKLPIQFFASGSAATLLVKQSESLAGRTIEETILPLSFAEWLNFTGKIPASIFGNSLELAFKEYLNKSGFPHLLEIDEREIWQKMLVEDIVTKAVYKDSVDLYGLREPAVLEKMFSYLACETSGLLNVSKLASTLGVERIKISNYLRFLENTLLVFPLRKYSRQIRQSLRSQEKIHVIDQGFNQVYPASEGSVLESLVARHFWARYPGKVYYWREFNEVDLVLDLDRKLIPIEIKNSRVCDQKKLQGLISFGRKFGVKNGLVLYFGGRRKKTDDNLEIFFEPVWEFLRDVDKGLGILNT